MTSSRKPRSSEEDSLEVAADAVVALLDVVASGGPALGVVVEPDLSVEVPVAEADP